MDTHTALMEIEVVGRLVVLTRYRVNPTWLVAGGAAVGSILERSS